MAIKTRLRRLETSIGDTRKYLSFWTVWGNVPQRFDPDRDLVPTHRRMWHSIATIPQWLEEQGYQDALAALEDGATGPLGLEDLLFEQAGYDRKHRAWARIERALEAGELPSEADLRLHTSTP